MNLDSFQYFTLFLACLSFLVFLDRRKVTKDQILSIGIKIVPPLWFRNVIWASLYASLFLGIWVWLAFGIKSFYLEIAWATGINLVTNYACLPLLRHHVETPTFSAYYFGFALFVCTKTALIVSMLQLAESNWVAFACWIYYFAWLVFAMCLTIVHLWVIETSDQIEIP